MDFTAYKSEHICRFPLPPELPPLWITKAGITHGDGQEETGISIEYVLSGTGVIHSGQKVYRPVAGDICILAGPGMSETDREDPWTKLFIRLKGTAALSLVQAFALDKKVLYRNGQETRSVFEEIFEAVNKDAPAEQIMEHGSMLIMKLLTRLCRTEMQDPAAPDEVRTVKRFIDNNYQRDLSMDDIAACVFRSNSHVQKQFRQVYGMTPYAYYMDLKIRYAKSLLLRTNLPVSQIADRLGYKSDRYFSVRFRQQVGMTATQFRRQGKED